MSEDEWLECANPTRMLEVLRGNATERKLRHFSVACCRLLLTKVQVSPLAGHKVDVAERYADGAASIEELADARCYSVLGAEEEMTDARYYSNDAECACHNAAEVDGGVIMADCAGGNAAWAGAKHGAEPPHDNGLSPIFNARFAAEQRTQCDLLRDIFGNPFHPVAIDPVWLAWHDGIIAKIAQSIYDERAFANLPIVADALEEAGCTNAELLAHCRHPGPHVRGCWAVDLLLGKT